MCGIIGVVSQTNVVPTLIQSLERLEYRGYDSSGVATVNNGILDRRRATGKLRELSNLLKKDPLEGKIGIGHTRWATHGSPTHFNAHPHHAYNVSLVHNGIIENFSKLRDELGARGSEFSSETDSEVIAQLLAYHLSINSNYRQALRKTLDRLEGAFALCIIFDGEENLMAFARQGSPLAIGYGENSMFIGSDAYSLANLTNNISYLQEGDWGLIKGRKVDIFDSLGTSVDRPIEKIVIETQAISKGQYPHFMLKEIHEQPTVVCHSLSQYLVKKNEKVEIDLPKGLPCFSNYDRIIMVACGTAFYACFISKYLFEKFLKVPVEVDIASELRYRNPPTTGRELAILVSQSGETADTLASLRFLKGKVKTTLAVVNVIESSIARESDFILPIRAGIEIGVASTKAFSCQLVVLAILAIKFSSDRKSLSGKKIRDSIKSLLSLPSYLTKALQKEQVLKEVSSELAKANDILFLGRGALFPLALEGALKLKEVSYIHAEGYAGGELKHGPIALVDEKIPIICFCPSNDLLSKTISNIEEVIARGGKVILITDKKGSESAPKGIWKTVCLPSVSPILTPALYAIPAQLLAYYTALKKGTDIDQPRNLAKSVTVE